MGYPEELREHLTKYKETVLGVSEPGVFRHRGRDLYYGHILPLAMADLNLFEEARAASAGLPRHRYFHHLNSSQAFAFNLFLPFLHGGPRAGTALLSAMGCGATAGPVREWALESVPDPREGTNIDATWLDSAGRRTFCEVKLSEQDVGTAKDDSRHRDKLARIYRPVLQGCVDDRLLEPAAFFGSYQFLRNVWHLVRVPNSRLIFLAPRANTGLWAQIEGLAAGVNDAFRSRVSVCATEAVIRALGSEAADCPQHLRDYARHKLARKYLP